LEEYKKSILGNTLTNLYFTEHNGPHDYCPGLVPAYYFATIMELNYNELFVFYADCIEPWNSIHSIILLTHENWHLQPEIIFHYQIINDISVNEEQQITIHLENGTAIQHTEEYGDKLIITNPFFDAITTPSIKHKQNIFSQLFKNIFQKMVHF
jgi:hypothetical protein